MLDKITGTSERVESAKAEMIDELGDVKTELTERIVAIGTALGTDPTAIQEAALFIKNEREEFGALTRELRDASITIIDFEKELGNLRADLGSIMSTLDDPESGMNVRLRSVERTLELMKGRLEGEAVR